MADEITAGPSTRSGDIALLFLYKSGIVLRTYTDADGATQTVVPTPASNLPEWADDLTTPAEKSGLDAGTLAFELDILRQTAGMTGADLSNQAKVQYDTKKAAFLILYGVKYHQFYGFRIDR